VLAGDGTVLMAASAPRTAELFQDWGFDVLAVDISEFEKMEGLCDLPVRPDRLSARRALTPPAAGRLASPQYA
jgi:hypothetical protein